MLEQPLVSFVVISYQQERFIREAVRSALAQTYQPLEIILSDDASTDRTFDIMRDEANAYQGPHKIILNRNPTNAGLAANFNRGCALTAGQLIVVQAGDDISMPHRAQCLMEAWTHPTSVDLVFSNAEIIDGDGKKIRDRWFQGSRDMSSVTAEDVFRRSGVGVLGCSTAFSRSLTAKYGELNNSVSAEDVVLSFRALLDRGIRYVDQVLVKYRAHANNLVLGRKDWRTNDRSRSRRDSVGRLAIVQDCLRAWELACSPDQALSHTLKKLERQYAYDVACYERSRVGSMLVAAVALCNGIGPRKTAGLIKRHVLRRK